MIKKALLDVVQHPEKPAIGLDGASWLVWPAERRSGVSAAMSSAQFVHLNAPVVAVQRNGGMEYFNEDGQREWTSNLTWPRANLKMARLPGRPDDLQELRRENSAEEASPE